MRLPPLSFCCCAVQRHEGVLKGGLWKKEERRTERKERKGAPGQHCNSCSCSSLSGRKGDRGRQRKERLKDCFKWTISIYNFAQREGSVEACFLPPDAF